MIKHDIVPLNRAFQLKIRCKLFFAGLIGPGPLLYFCLNDVFSRVVDEVQVYSTSAGLDFKKHISVHNAYEMIEICVKEVLSDVFLWSLRYLQNAETSAGDERLEVIQEQLHFELSCRGEVINEIPAALFGEVCILKSVKCRLEYL